MNGESTTGIEDIVRRNVAALRSKANLTQQGLADEMLLRGVAWTRETVAQVETTNRRLGFTEAIAVAASLDVPLARLAATGAATVAVGESEWTAAYLGAAMAGTSGDMFPPETYASRPPRTALEGAASERIRVREESGPPPVRDERPPVRHRPASRDLGADAGPEPAAVGRGSERVRVAPQQRTAERIERRLRLRVTATDVDDTAQRLWSRSLESERERRVTDRLASAGGSLKTIRGHVSRDLDRELAHEMSRHASPSRSLSPTGPVRFGPSDADEAAWEATRLNIVLANKGYSDSDVTRWWNFTRHRELENRTIAEAWRARQYSEVSRLVQSLPDKHATSEDFSFDQ